MGDQSNVSGYDPFYDRAIWEFKFTWWPQRCDKTNEEIWFKRAYRGTRVIHGPAGELPIFERRWLTRDIWTIEKLKGNI